MHMKRDQFHHDGLTFSYLDMGGKGQALIALHAHWLEAVTYDQLASALAPTWRTIAMDQRGHGHSDHAQSYTREEYLGDLAALFDYLMIEQAVLLGNSLGGVNAYQFAARYPERVRALIIEDIGVEIAADTSFTLPWGGVFPNRDALSERIGERMLPYLLDSFRKTSAGWQLAFDPQEMLTSQLQLNGDHWPDWLASSCPALLIRGRESRLTTQIHLEEMAARRPNTRLVTLGGGHIVHADNPSRFIDTVQKFLHEI
jgi:pimeloyl-ACP methyl ester carboxylesterase